MSASSSSPEALNVITSVIVGIHAAFEASAPEVNGFAAKNMFDGNLTTSYKPDTITPIYSSGFNVIASAGDTIETFVSSTAVAIFFNSSLFVSTNVS